MIEFLSQWKKLITSSFVLFILILIPSVTIRAEPSYRGYTTLLPYLEKSSILSDVWRWIVWLIISASRSLASGAEEGMMTLITLPHQFFNSNQLTHLLRTLNTLYFVFFAPVLIYLGYKLWYSSDPNHELIKKIFRNTIFTLILITGLSWLMGVGNNLMQASVGMIHSQSDLTLTEDLVRHHIVDIEHAYQFGQNFSPNQVEMMNNLSTFEYFKINELADREIFTHEIRFKNGSSQFVELEDGSFGFWTINFLVEHLYRYQVINPFILILQLLLTCVAYVFSGIKFARLIFELGFKNIIATGVAIFDLEGSGKFKKLLSDIGNTFILMFMVVLLFAIYTHFVSWTNHLNLNIYATLLLRLGGALALIDGPKIVEKLTGQDAGLSSDAARGAILAGAAIKGVKGTGKAMIGTGKAAIGTVMTGGNFIKGTADGIKTAKSEQENPAQDILSPAEGAKQPSNSMERMQPTMNLNKSLVNTAGEGQVPKTDSTNPVARSQPTVNLSRDSIESSVEWEEAFNPAIEEPIEAIETTKSLNPNPTIYSTSVTRQTNEKKSWAHRLGHQFGRTLASGNQENQMVMQSEMEKGTRNTIHDPTQTDSIVITKQSTARLNGDSIHLNEKTRKGDK